MTVFEPEMSGVESICSTICTPNHCPLKLCYFLTIYFPFQGLVIIIIVLARIGWRGATIAHFIDPLWLTSIITGAYILILGTLYFTYILGEQIAYKMVN